MANNDREIERKYLLRALPQRVNGARALEIDQGYLPGARINERIRRSLEDSSVKYFRTIKAGQGAGLDRDRGRDDRAFFLGSLAAHAGRSSL
jgi:hypothetical protein